MPDPDLVTTRMAADILGKPLRTVQLYATDGRLPPAYTFDNGYLFYRADVEALLAAAS